MSNSIKENIDAFNIMYKDNQNSHKSKYKEQYRYIANKLFSVKRNYIEHIIFFKKFQAIISDLPHIYFIFKSNLISNKEMYKYCFDENLQTHNSGHDDYFYIEAKVIIYIKCSYGLSECRFFIPTKYGEINAILYIKDMLQDCFIY